MCLAQRDLSLNSLLTANNLGRIKSAGGWTRIHPLRFSMIFQNYFEPEILPFRSCLLDVRLSLTHILRGSLTVGSYGHGYDVRNVINDVGHFLAKPRIFSPSWAKMTFNKNSNTTHN